jgi:hypothetical protein
MKTPTPKPRARLRRGIPETSESQENLLTSSSITPAALRDEISKIGGWR